MGMDMYVFLEFVQVIVLEVLVGNEVLMMIVVNNEYVFIFVVSYVILIYNVGWINGFVDGIIIMFLYNLLQDGGFKYNMINGGLVEGSVIVWIEVKVNEILENGFKEVKRLFLQKVLKVYIMKIYDYLDVYIVDFDQVIDLEVIWSVGLEIGVDFLGGVGVCYWECIVDCYNINLNIVDI